MTDIEKITAYAFYGVSVACGKVVNRFIPHVSVEGSVLTVRFEGTSGPAERRFNEMMRLDKLHVFVTAMNEMLTKHALSVAYPRVVVVNGEPVLVATFAPEGAA